MAIRILRAILRKWLSLEHRIASRWHKASCLLGARLDGCHLTLGEGVVCHIPVRVRGKGHVRIDDHVSFGRGPSRLRNRSAVTIYAGSEDAVIRIGAGTFFNNDSGVTATCSVELGARCLIGDQVAILDSDFHDVDPALRHSSHGKAAAIVLEDNVWLAARVMVMKGVRIGENTVVGAGSVVTKSLAANVFAGGVPAKTIREI